MDSLRVKLWRKKKIQFIWSRLSEITELVLRKKNKNKNNKCLVKSFVYYLKTITSDLVCYSTMKSHIAFCHALVTHVFFFSLYAFNAVALVNFVYHDSGLPGLLILSSLSRSLSPDTLSLRTRFGITRQLSC